MTADDRKYCPLIPGTILKYRGERRDGRSESEVEVLTVTRQSDHTAAKCRNRSGHGADAAERIFILRRTATGILDDRQLLIPFPSSVDRTWSHRFYSYTVTAVDADVETPAKLFSSCLEVTYQNAQSEGDGGQRYYAPWVGLVRHDHAGDEPWTRQLLSAHVPFEIFLSHASEDTETVVRPLAEELGRRGFLIWYDENDLRVGDRLNDVLDGAIRNSICAVAVLSAPYLTKRWTRFELNAIGDKLRFAVLHGVTWNDCHSKLPDLRETRCQPSAAGVAVLAEAIIESLPDWMAQ